MRARLDAPPIHSAVLLRVGATRVWAALTTPEGIAGWFCNSAEVDLRPGGHMRFHWIEHGPELFTGHRDVTIEALEPQRRFAWSWVSHEGRPRTLVSFTLEPRGPITVLRLDETGWGDCVDGAIDNAGGWGGALMAIKAWLEHGVRLH